MGLVLWSLAGACGFVALALGGAPKRDDGPLDVGASGSRTVGQHLFGQFGLLLAALFVGALRALPTRPMLAGVLIGVLTIKPQLGLLLPMLLSARRLACARRRSVERAAALRVERSGVRVEPWRVYVSETMPFQWHFIEVMDGFYRFQMITPYTLFWFLGLSVQAALVLQGIVSFWSPARRSRC